MAILYKRSSFNNYLKKQFPQRRIDKDLDILIYLNYVLFVKRLAKVSSNITSQQPKKMKQKSTKITDGDIRKSTEQVLREFRG